MDRSFRENREKINKKTVTLNDTLNELDLIDMYRTFHSKAVFYPFFSRAHRTFSRIDHMLGHKINLKFILK